jgi:serine O-acetyltransferase
MKETMKDIILNASADMTESCHKTDFIVSRGERCLPDRSCIIRILKDLKRVMFPGYFGEENIALISPQYFIGDRLIDIYGKLKPQVEISLYYRDFEKYTQEEISERAEEVCETFFKKLPYVQQMLLKDVQAGFDGDPAAKSKEEIISSYPGVFAIYVYRLAHILYVENVPHIPRIMTEYAHGKTGIDINPGAVIGDYFFIDHGTGVVIGETTEIGRNVKLYQGVTLGALSTRQGQQLANVKRHPTICDNVTIYSNSSVLGGETVIGENTIIGGNTFITESIPANTKVSAKSPELVIKKPRNAVSKADVWDWQD